jgi:hypothetical protein
MLKPNEKILLEKLSKEKQAFDSFAININGYTFNTSWNFVGNTSVLPVVVFGLTDFYGNYRVSKPETISMGNLPLLPKNYRFSFFHNITNQRNVPNDIPKLKTGDLVHVFDDDSLNNYFLVVQSCDKIPYYSLLNAANNRFNVKRLKITCKNNIELKNQIQKSFNVFKIEPNGNFKTNTFTPVSYITTKIPDGSNTITINWEFKINENFGFGFEMVSNQIILNFIGTW